MYSSLRRSEGHYQTPTGLDISLSELSDTEACDEEVAEIMEAAEDLEPCICQKYARRDVSTGERNLCNNCIAEVSDIGRIPVTSKYETNSTSLHQENQQVIQPITDNLSNPRELEIILNHDPEVFGTYLHQYEAIHRRRSEYRRRTMKPKIIPTNLFLKMYYHPYEKTKHAGRGTVKQTIEDKTKRSFRNEYFRIVEPNSPRGGKNMTGSPQCKDDNTSASGRHTHRLLLMPKSQPHKDPYECFTPESPGEQQMTKSAAFEECQESVQGLQLIPKRCISSRPQWKKADHTVVGIESEKEILFIPRSPQYQEAKERLPDQHSACKITGSEQLATRKNAVAERNANTSERLMKSKVDVISSGFEFLCNVLKKVYI